MRTGTDREACLASLDGACWAFVRGKFSQFMYGFYPFDQANYLEVVRHYAAKAELDVPWETLRAEALRWSVRRASRSGRTARQFIDDAAGRKALARSD